MNKIQLLVAIVFSIFTLQLSAQGITQTQWQMHDGKGDAKIEFKTDSLGCPTAYNIAEIPDMEDSGWRPTEKGKPEQGKLTMDRPSKLSNDQNNLTGVNFTYFQCIVSIPLNTTINTFTIDFGTFGSIDDGARAYVFNTAYPNGSSELGADFIMATAYANHKKGIKTNSAISNFADKIMPGYNRIVIVQFDNCGTNSYIKGGKLVIDGKTQSITSGYTVKTYADKVAKPIVLTQTPDITQEGNNWTNGWGTSGGEDFHLFDKKGYFPNNKTVQRFYHSDYYWSAAQNTTNEAWAYTQQSITFPPKSKGAIALHPGPQRNQYAKVRYTASENGTYNFNVKFKALDKQFSKAKAEIWTNSGGNWKQHKEIILTKDMYNKNNGSIEEDFSFQLNKGQMVSIELENAGKFNNDYTEVILVAEKQAEYIPDMKVENEIWTYGYGKAGEDFNPFTKKGDYSSGSPVQRHDNGNQWWSAAQNTSDKSWTDQTNSITFPPKSIGAIALHPGPKVHNYSKVRYTAPANGKYIIHLKFKHLDAQFSEAKAEIWTNSGGKWYEFEEVSLTKIAYDNNNGVLEKVFQLTLNKGEVISVDIEAAGSYANDYTQVIFGVNKK